MNSFQDLLERQKRHFATGATRSYARRIASRLDRMAPFGRTRRRSSGRSRRTSRPPVRSRSSRRSPASASSSSGRACSRLCPGARAGCARGHRAPRHRLPRPLRRCVDRRPPNGPLLLLLRSAIAALAAGNCCVLKLSSALKATTALLLDLVPKHEQRSLSCTRSFMD